MSQVYKIPRKLIETALPLDHINSGAAEEKSNPFLKGHPRSLHQWWARRPNAAARAVIFAQLVNDPGFQSGAGFKYGMNKVDAARERTRLFSIIERLSQWENSDNRQLMQEAYQEIKKSWMEVCELNKGASGDGVFNADKIPVGWDPFSGGGAIPLEFQRLGLSALASDLNPIAVMISKASIEIPSLFRDLPAISDQLHKSESTVEIQGSRSSGIANDVLYYSQWVQTKAKDILGAFYPPVLISKSAVVGRDDLAPYAGHSVPVSSWIWARTVPSPSPAFNGVHVPLLSTYILSNKKGKEAYLHPVTKGKEWRFEIKTGCPPDDSANGTKASTKGAGFRCLISGAPIDGDYIKAQGKSGNIGYRLICIVGEGNRMRLFLPPTLDQEQTALRCDTGEITSAPLPRQALGFSAQLYFDNGQFKDFFLPRQAKTLHAYSLLIHKAVDQIKADIVHLNLPKTTAVKYERYAESIAVYLAMGISKMADYNNSMCTWNPTNLNIGHLFTKQAIPMAWDFPESNPFVGGLAYPALMAGIAKSVEALPGNMSSRAIQHNCASDSLPISNAIISTDPPYYDNIGYADLSDFFYPWMRSALRPYFSEIFSSSASPKSEELVADPNRHGGRNSAESFFLQGMKKAIRSISRASIPGHPFTIYYAFKQSETKDGEGTLSKGWATFLDAIVDSGIQITGTWPMRTEREARSRGQNSNALASSVVIVCRQRPDDAPKIGRRDFIRELNGVLPESLDEMTRGSVNSPVAPVDLSQAIIGPGMAIFSKYSAVLEADGSPMPVRTALQLINRFLAEDDFDHDTQFCLAWFQQFGWTEGRYGDADVLARSKGTSVDGCKQAGVVDSGGGIVRLLKPTEYPSGWDPKTDRRLPVWEALHQMIRTFRSGGESDAGRILAAVAGKAEAIRQLAYRLYTLCERSGRSDDARAYNELVTSWAPIEAASMTIAEANAPKQTTLFDK